MIVRFIALYLAAAVTANLLMAHVLAHLPFETFLVVDFLVCFGMIAVDLVVRDALHERWEGPALWPRMLLLVGAGSLLAFAINGAAGRVALASFLAFFAAGMTDTFVYHLARRFPRFRRVTLSNLASAFTDSVVWPLVALGAFTPLVTSLEFSAKVLGGVVWAALLIRTIWRESTGHVA